MLGYSKRTHYIYPSRKGSSRNVIMLARQDGSQAADRERHHYMRAKMWRFDAAMTSAMNSGETRS